MQKPRAMGQKKVVITLDDKKLSDNGLTASSVTGLLQANNISFPTGQIVAGGQAIPVRVTNQFTSVDNLRNLVVKPEIFGSSAASGASSGGAPGGAGATGGAQGGPPSGGAQTQGSAQGGGAQGQGTAQGGTQSGGAQGQGGAQGSGQAAASGSGSQPAAGASARTRLTPAVKLSDVASVELVNANAGSISRSNGKPSLSLIIYKTQNANTVQVADAVNKRVDELKSEVPGTETVVLFDSSTWIKESLDGLIREGVLGALLAIAVILLFLRSFRSTLVTALSIPLSLLIALIMLNVFNISLNIMSLAGLAVAIGRVVDDSIVVLENIYRHHFQRGEPIREAAYNGTKEVATAITSSTITTVCVFLPLGFIAGLVSEFFRPFAVAVTVSLQASLLVALTVIPVLATFFLKTGVAKDPRKSKARELQAERDTFVQKVYTPTINWVLKNWLTKSATLTFALVLFVGSMFLVPFIGFSFINFGSDKVLSATLDMKPGTDLKTTSDTAALVEAEIQKHPNVLNYQTTIGSNVDAQL